MTRTVLVRIVGIFGWSLSALWNSHAALSAAEPIEDVLSATFRLTDKNTSATSFLVQTGEKSDGVVLITAAHFFEKMSGDECWLILRARQADDIFVRREHRLVVREDGKPRWTKHPGEDIAGLPVELPADVECVPFRLHQLASEADLKARRVRVAQEAWIPGFPAQLEANEAGWPVLRRGSIATHPLLPLTTTKTLLVNVASFGGDSGAPVVVFPSAEKDTPPLVAGILVGMHRQSDKVTTPFEEKTTHTPLNLAIVVQGPLVRETVELLVK
jgi:hypothetical protein